MGWAIVKKERNAGLGLDFVLKLIKASGCEMNCAYIERDKLDECIAAIGAAAARSGAEISVMTGRAPNGSSLLGLLIKVPAEVVTNV